MVRKGGKFCCKMKSSKFPPLRLLGEIVCGHADECETERYRCRECGKESAKPGIHHGKGMELVKEKKIV